MRNGSTRVLGIILFTLIGASALVLGIMSTGRGISTPLKADLAATARFDEAVGGNASAGAEDLRSKDTDGDGVSDHDELNLYRTSPYIKDSDSDGISDGDELNKGTDPNCPEGKDCGIQVGSTDTSSTDSDFGPSEIPSGTIPKATIADAASIRALLKEQGLTDELLNSIDDKELIDMYNESTNVVGGTQQ